MAQTRTDMVAPGPMPIAPPKELLRLGNYLATLEHDPDDVEALAGLKRLAQERDAERLGSEPVRTLESARQAHELRGEYATVARLIEIEVELVENDKGFAASLWKELGRLRSEFLLDGAGATAAYTRALELKPDDNEVQEALKRLEQAESSWKKFAKRFVEEAESAADLSLKTSLLLRAAGLAWEHRRKAKAKDADRLFHEVLEIDKGNLRAIMLYEHTLREREEWKDLAQHLLDSAEAVHDKQDSHHLYLRAARVLSRKLHDKSRAVACYERVLDHEPGNSEALLFLTDRFTESERWDDLVQLYESALRVPHKLDVEQGILVQLGMVHYRMRNKPADAEPYFARLRKLDPTHPAMLDFYRQHLPAAGELERLLKILSDAQRIVSDPTRRLALAVETAQLAQKTGGMGERAIDAWKNVQRLDPQHREAARVLKELYAKSEKWNALCEVLKAQIDATPDESQEQKIELLRELSLVYRDKLRLDGMLINVYNTILRLSPHDRATLSALADKYRELGRWNDLINVLVADADASSDSAHRIETYLKVAKLWVEHFSNYNQASAPLEKVLELDPKNRAALSMLREIYEKKRAWKQLFEVLKKERDIATDPEQRAGLTMQLASLAAERLHRYDDAVALWREVAESTSAGSIPAPEELSTAPYAATSASSSAGYAALEAIEKLAEREKDWKTLAGVLDQQVARQKHKDDKIRVLLKLGGVFADRLADPAGASEVYRRVLELDPKQGRALRSLRDSLVAAGDWAALETLYERAADFEGLVDVLSGEADRVSAKELKIALSLRVARLLEQKINEPLRAQRSYERVLSVSPEHLQAAEALAPIYEHEEKWSRLYAMLEIVLRQLPAGDQALPKRLEVVQRLRVLAQDKLRDSALSLSHALHAYRLAPGDQEVREALERSAELAQAFDKVVEAYSARATAADVPPEEALELRRRIALIASVRLGKPDLAAEQWELVLVAVPDEQAALAALDRIYRGGERHADVRKLLSHKLRFAPDVAAKKPLLKELAELEEGELANPDAAAEHYRALAELESDNSEVWAALDRLALAAGRHDELANVLEWRLSLAADKAAKVELGARLGSVFMERLSQPERARATFAEVVDLDPAHGASITALEQLASQEPASAAQIHTILERAFERAGRFDKLAKLLSERVATTKDEAELRRLRLRLAEISSGQLGDALGAYASLEAAFLQEPEDASLWERLAEAAEHAGQQRALASAYAQAVDRESLPMADRTELSARIARIYDEELGEPLEAEPFHRRVLAQDPLSDRAFTALKDLYTNEERWEDLQQLYRRRLEDTVDAAIKLDLLLQVCFLFEEILEQPDKAVEAYRAVLELIPDHGPSRRTLEKLYEKLERYRDLAALLRSNLEDLSGYDQVDTLYRLAELHETKLGEPALAVDYYEQVLQVQPHHLRTQAALGRLLAVEALRQRIANILEPHYESQGAYADLVRVLEIQLADRSDVADKAELLFRIGQLNESRLRDAEGAFSAFARAVEAQPSLLVAREALARAAAPREVFRKKRAQVLEQASEHVSDAEARIDILQELAKLLIDDLDDKPAAERCYTRLLELTPDRDDLQLEAARQLERIHLHTGDHAGLARDLSRQVDLEFDARVREQLLLRLAELYDHKLDKPAKAIETQRKRLELDNENADALIALERLYAATGAWEELVEVLQRRLPTESNDEERRAIARRGALVLEEKIGDLTRAIEAHREIAQSFGPDRETLSSLARLYETTGRHGDLLETLEAHADFAENNTERATLRFRIAELLKDKLAEPERAIGSYEAALEDEPEHAGSLAALDAIMHDEASEWRMHAARALAPRYEVLRRYDKLLAVLELSAQTDDPHDKLLALQKAGQVAEGGLRDLDLALRYAGRALAAGASHGDLTDLLGEFARLAEMSGRYADYVVGLQAIVPELTDAQSRIIVYREIAGAAQDKLQDATLARTWYRKVLEEDGEDLGALDALLPLDEEAKDYPALIDVLGRKTALSVDLKQRLQLLEKQADVYERGLDDPERAIGALEEVLVEEPRPSAYASLERLYQRTHKFTELAALYDQQLERNVGNPVDLRYRLAKTYRQSLNDTGTALAHLRDALTDDPDHADSIGLAEAIMSEHGEHRTQAAEILEPGYLARMDWEKLTAALRARADAETDSAERMRLLVRLARIYEEQLEDFDETLEIYSRLYREDFRDEEVWETLTRLAKVGGHWNRLAKILSEPLLEQPVEDDQMAKLARYVGALYDEKVNNLVKAAEFYGKALAFAIDDAYAFRALESAYLRSGNHAALLELYTEQASVAVDDAERVALLHKRARLYKGELRELPLAIATYREILEVAANDHTAVASLEALLAETKDWSGLAEHLRWRIEHASAVKEELELKHRLGELLLKELSDEEGAIELFDQIVQAEPRHVPTLSALERIVQGEKHRLRVTEILEPVYRQLDQWKKLVAIHEARLLLLTDHAEIARLLSEVGELHERRGQDLGRAFHAYARAFVHEPDNEAVRGNIDRLAEKTGAWADHVGAYEAALASATEPGVKLMLLQTIARVHDDKRGDPRAAILAYERMLEVDASDVSTLDALEALHTMVADWRGLVKVLERKVALAYNSEDRASLLRRIGSVYEEFVGDRQAAVDAYQRAATELDTDELALEALDRLYAVTGQAVQLFETLKRRVDLATDPALRVELGLRLGFLADTRLHYAEEAIAAYRRVLDDDDANSTAISHLSTLFQRLGMWNELLDNLRLQVALASAPATRVALHCRAGEILLDKLLDPAEAIEAFKRAIDEDAQCVPAIDALLTLTVREEHRAEAAAVVEPLLREQGRFDDLVKLIGRKIDSMMDPGEKRAELIRLAEVEEHGRRDKFAAFEALSKALVGDTPDEFVQEELERLARELASWSKFFAVLIDRAARLPDANDASAMFRRAGRVAEEEMGDDARAIEAFRSASVHDDDADETLSALDRLYEKTQQWEALVDVLERRVAGGLSDAERAELLTRLGFLRAQRLGDPRGAFAAYKEVLDNDPGDASALAGMQLLGERDDLVSDVLEVLERCYREINAVEKVVQLFELRSRLASTDAEKARLLREAAMLWERDLNEPGRAFLCLRQAFELDSQDLSQLDELERIAGVCSAFGELCALAERVLANSTLDASSKRELSLRAAAWNRDFAGDAQGELRCLRIALTLDREDEDVHARVCEVLREEGDRRALLAALRAFAEIDRDDFRARASLHEAGAIALELSDFDAASACFERVLELDAEDAAALSALAELRTNQGRYAEATQLLSRWLVVESDAERRRVLHHGIAEAYAGLLQDPEQAAQAYRALLEEFPDDERAVSALEDLYEKLGRWAELERSLRERLPDASPEQRTDIRLRLARVSEVKLGRPELALEQLREVLADTPGHEAAAREFERLLRAAGMHEELASWLEQRADDARAAADPAHASQVLASLATLYEKQLGDPTRAIEALLRILEYGQELPVVRELVRLYDATSQPEQVAEFMELQMGIEPAAQALPTAHALAELATTRLSDPALAQRALLHAHKLAPRDPQTSQKLRAHFEANAQWEPLAQLLQEEVALREQPSEQIAVLREISALYAKRIGDNQRAGSYLERALSLVPGDRETLLALCDLYIASGRESSAIPLLEQLIASFGGRRAKEVATYEHRLGRAYEGAGKPEEAYKHYDAAFRIDLTSVPVLRDLGRLCLERGDLDRAQKTYRALLLQKLGDDAGIHKADVYYYLGEISAKQGDKPKAKAMLERAISEGGQHAKASALLGTL